MNKIKYSLIRKLYKENLTSDELSMIIYLAKKGDDLGTVQGVYYKECAKELYFSHAQFYNILNSLETKGYIIREKKYSEDIDITLADNCFIVPGEDLRPEAVYRDYLNLNMEIFNDKAFYALRAGAKKLILALIVKAVNDKARRIRQGGKTYAKIFHVPMREYEVYSEKLGVTKRMVRQYFKEIAKWVSTYNDSEYTNTDIITVKESAIGKPSVTVSQKGKTIVQKRHDSFDSDVNYIRMLCRRHKIDADDDSLTDTAMLLTQYGKRAAAIGQSIRKIADRALSVIGTILNAAGMNRYISNYLGSYQILPETAE